ncbi:Uncharacterised protein [Yersinia frederiksenii]|uniref:Uncharacterized protein n=1 Tax=Yersinia frederiksenii TaxID=29484 RepID=A0A380PWK6_YERFR|nr:hypothetical protein [Yersinia frederiksenii]SUP77347.1 Uncharacterised protein [Yersinia frederiksenii]
MELDKKSVCEVFHVPADALKNVEAGPNSEPKIIASNMSNDELLRWMDGKVRSAKCLQSALAERESTKQDLSQIESKISYLTNSAALELLNADQKQESGEITVKFDNVSEGITSPTQSGKSLALTVNGAVLIAFNTHNAVAADYLNFIDSVTKAMLNDSDGLEKEANMSGRTIKHASFKTFGSWAIADPKGL